MYEEGLKPSPYTYSLSMGSLEQYYTRTEEAPDVTLGEGYELLRDYEDEDGDFTPFDHVIYYPGIDGGQGYVYYIGMHNGWSDYDEKWFLVSEEGEAALQAALAENGINLTAEAVSFTQSPTNHWADFLMLLEYYRSM